MPPKFGSLDGTHIAPTRLEQNATSREASEVSSIDDGNPFNRGRLEGVAYNTQLNFDDECNRAESKRRFHIGVTEITIRDPGGNAEKLRAKHTDKVGDILKRYAALVGETKPKKLQLVQPFAESPLNKSATIKSLVSLQEPDLDLLIIAK